MKKILLILIISVITAAIFTACTDESDDDTQITTTPDGETTPVSEDEDTAGILRDMPDYFDQYVAGNTLKVFTFDTAVHGVQFAIFNTRDIATEEETGDPINDAVYRRNAVLKEKYGFELEPVLDNSWGDDNAMTNSVRRAVLAGDRYFDVFLMPLFLAGGAAQEGLLLDLSGVQYLDFEKPWWDKGAAKNLSIGNRLFFAIGDSVLMNKDETSVILFNKQLLSDLHLENPYELVRGGQWTLDKLREMSREAMADLDGNGEMDSETDRFGYLPGNSFGTGILLSLGVRFADKDENDLPFLTFASERTFTAVDANLDFTTADFVWWPSNKTLSTGDGTLERVFDEGRALFYLARLRSVERLRGMETDFGILPMPRLDEYQPEYGHWVGALGQALAIPSFYDSDTSDKIGFMLDVIAEESLRTVIPAYYEVQLKGKLTRDDESHEMLDIIFNSIVWDPGRIYGWFEGNDTFNDAYLTASRYESQLGRIESRMQATVDAFANID